MAGRGIRIPLVADVADVLRGNRQVADSLDQVDRKLHQVDQTGRTAADGSTWTAYSGHARKAQADVESAGHRVRESMSEVRSEAMQNVGEAVSQMASSGASAADTIGGTFGGLVGSLGPIGAAIAGIGGVAFGAWAGHARAMAAAVEGYTNNAVANLEKTGRILVSTNDNVATSIANNVTKLSSLAKSARTAGVEQVALIRAMNGDKAAAAALIPQLEAIALAHTKTEGAGRNLRKVTDEQGQAAKNLAQDLRDQNKAMSDAQHNAVLYAASLNKIPRKVDVVFNAIVKGNQAGWASIPASGFRGSVNNRSG